MGEVVEGCDKVEWRKTDLVVFWLIEAGKVIYPS